MSDATLEENQAMYRWSFDKFDRHERGTLWYVVAGIVVGALLVYSIATGNILFGVIVFLTVIIVFARHVRASEETTCEITAEGIRVDGRECRFVDIAMFSIVPTSHGMHILYIHEGRGLKHSVPVPLPQSEDGIVEIREFLSNFIDEDIEHVREPIWDHLMRVLKL